ncbi:ABC transporter substrate-binding protein [Psychroserpens sp. XS_ASV72]|uniref:ABC transporter substrate-binding protein n=1 Tax=Psychroserpens sp. XS_ASV72 TaxID=3241293 RepID=UPI003514CB7F
MVLKDQLNRLIKLEKTPKRIVSLVPSQTELICDLGLESSLVGVTKFCVHPLHLRSTKTVVGGTKTIHLHKIRSLKPDIILCNKEENTEAMIADLEQIAPVHISDIYTLEDSLELIEMYGDLLHVKTEANQMIEAIRSEYEVFQTYIRNKPTTRVAYFIWKNPWMVAARHTFIDNMLAVNKFVNVFSELERYPVTELSDLKIRQPEVILLSSEPFPFKEKDKKELHEELPNATIKIVDGEMFSWYGSRLLKAFQYFKALHQDVLM